VQVIVAISVILGGVGGAIWGWYIPAVLRWAMADPTINARRRWTLTGASLAGAAVPVVAANSATVLAWWWFAGCSVALAAGDVARHRLPNRLVLPAITGGVLWLLLAVIVPWPTQENGNVVWTPSPYEWSDWGRALLAAGAVGVAYLALAMLSPSGLGMGDVKLSPLVGLYLGWSSWTLVVWGVFLGFVAGAILAMVAAMSQHGRLRSRMTAQVPFGPAMLAGAAIAAGATGGI